MFCEKENRILLSTQVIVASMSSLVLMVGPGPHAQAPFLCGTDALNGLCHCRSFRLAFT